MKASLLLAALVLVSTTAFGANLETIASSSVKVNPSRITDRTVLVEQKGNDGLLVQVIAEKTNGSTDVSNTHRIVLAISQIGEEYEKEASFEIGRSMGLDSAKRVSGGVYQLAYNDADALEMGSSMAVTKTIDARTAVNLVKNGQCDSFEVCVIKTSVKVKTTH